MLTGWAEWGSWLSFHPHRKATRLFQYFCKISKFKAFVLIYGSHWCYQQRTNPLFPNYSYLILWAKRSSFFQMQSTSVADQLRFASHSVRSRLDEIKRREISRLNELEKKYANLNEKKTTHHVDQFNPHTFEIEDLKKLIRKVTSDLVEIDQKQEKEYKEWVALNYNFVFQELYLTLFLTS